MNSRRVMEAILAAAGRARVVVRMGTRANRNQAHGMRQRLRPLRARFMARRPGLDGRFSLSPRERRILGWVVAIVLVLGIALVVRVVGGDADGAPVTAD